MPRGDRIGPMGMGPMTGRGAGYCAGYDAPGFMNSMYGRPGWPAGYPAVYGYRRPSFFGRRFPAGRFGLGFGRGWGRGRGRGRGWFMGGW